MESDEIPICDAEGHDYVYDTHYRRHYCKNCDQNPPLDWLDMLPLDITDIERCPCCNAPRDKWDYCDLCR
jgi:hypothetical protein